MNKININEITNYFIQLQTRISISLEKEEIKKKFTKEIWNRRNVSYGITRIIENGLVFEKAGVNFSFIKGKKLFKSALPNNKNTEGRPFIATGVSSVIHPNNPYVPTAHFNIRFFISENGDWWFGGGFDLTPYYPFKKDCLHWHKASKNLCDKYKKNIYLNYKNWADKYFYIEHRKESRGVGGIFFDYLNKWGFKNTFNFVKDVGNSFMLAYIPIVKNRKCKTFTKKEKMFQLYRRGRYVEFNLIYDRGTLFGLQSKGRIESILMSLPPKVIWHYNYHPNQNRKEDKLYRYYLKPKNWI